MRYVSSVYKDQLPGGVGDDKTPEDFDEEDIEEGAIHEMEHTFDPDIATEIAVDHLTEDINYYRGKKVSSMSYGSKVTAMLKRSTRA